MRFGLSQPNLLLHPTHRLGDGGQEAGGAVVEGAVHFMRQGEELVVALAGESRNLAECVGCSFPRFTSSDRC